MTINFKDSNKFKTIYDIKTVQENGEDVFDDNEKTIFIYVNKLENAIKVAELLVKVKEALNSTVKNESLATSLEEQKAMNKGQGSFAWQTINKHDHYCQRALNRLHRFGAPSEDIPADKAARQTKIDELKVEQSKKKSKAAENSDRQISYNRQLMNLMTEKREAEKNYHRSYNLIAILRGDEEGEIFDANGQRKKISSLAGEKIIKDYEGSNVSKPDTGTGAIGTGTGNEKKGTLKVLIAYAQTFLDRIKTHKATHETTASEYIEATSLATDFNSRRFNCKHFITSNPGDLGHSFWKVLKDIGVDNLKKAIKKSGLSSGEQTKMEKYAKEITAHASRTHQITGSMQPDTKLWVTSYDNWQPGLLKRGYDVFPHVQVPDYEHVFEFMKKVFPATFDSSNRVTGLVSKPYYDSNDDSFLKPSSGEKGWKGLSIGGYAINLPSGATEKSLAAYIKKKEGKAGFDNRLAGQSKPSKIPDDWEFKSLVGLWWNVFAHHMNNPNPSINDYTWKSNDITMSEKCRRQNLDQIRYARTMKAVLKEFGVASGDEFDEYLLKIGDKVDKKELISPRDKIVERALVERETNVLKVGNRTLTFREAIKEKLVWGEDYEWENVIDQLFSIVDVSQNEVLRIESDIEQVRKQISGISSDNATLQLEIDSLEDHINLLKSLGKDEEKPLDKNKNDFQTLYDEKSKQDNKWTRNQLRRMESLLNTIKTKMNDDAAFDTEFKDKQTEIKDKVSELGKYDQSLQIIWYTIKREAGDSVTDTIKKIIKEKDTIGTSLEDIAKQFEELDKVIKIDEAEKVTWDEINKAITSPDDYRDKPTSVLTKEELTTIFNFTADDALLTKWNTLTKAKIEEIVGNKYAKGKPNSKYEDLISHLKEKGDIDEEKYTGNTDDEKDASWKKFIEKGPEKVIKTIIVHENDDALKKDSPDKTKRNALIKGMRDDTSAGYDADSTKSKFKVEKYGDPTEGKEDDVTREQIISYLYDKALGKIEQRTTTPEDENDGGGGSQTTDDTKWYQWGGYMVFWLPPLVIIGGVAIFWKQISEWWNGPAEEEGAGAKEGGEEEETEKEE